MQSTTGAVIPVSGLVGAVLTVALFFGAFATPVRAAVTATECVVLLHGMARSADSMWRVEDRLLNAGFEVVNVDYPSTSQAIEALAESAVGQGLADCSRRSAEKVHFVTHSLGGILVRVYFNEHEAGPGIGRVVMLGPPNNGSELVDNLRNVPGFQLVNGPAADQLGTGLEGLPGKLGAVKFELGIIAGNQSVNPFYSWLLPEQDDGKVTVESTRVEGMKSHVVLPVTHTFMMLNPVVIDHTVHFLWTGEFMSAVSREQE